MLSSIHPLGERAKHNRFAVTATAFAVGATLGGALLGTVAGLVGLAVRALLDEGVALAVLACVALVAAFFEWRGRALPSIPRQVDENWLNEYRGWVYGAGFGFQLGAGVLTYITSAAVYVTIAAAVLVGHLLAAVAIGAAFGLVRGLTLVPARRITDSGALVSFHRRLADTAGTVRAVSTSAIVVIGLVAALNSIQEIP